MPVPLCCKMQGKVEKLIRSIYFEAYFSNFHLFIVVDMSSLKTSPYEINPLIPADYKWWYKSGSMVCSWVLSAASAWVDIQLVVVHGVVHGLIPPLHPLLPERQEEFDLVGHCDAVPLALHDYRFATLIVYIMGFLLKKFFTCIYVDL